MINRNSEDGVAFTAPRYVASHTQMSLIFSTNEKGESTLGAADFQMQGTFKENE